MTTRPVTAASGDAASQTTRPPLPDVIAAVATAVVLGLGELVLGAAGRNAWGIVLATTLLMATALAWRRARPVVSAASVYLLALGHLLLGVPVLPGDVLVLVALWSVTVHGPRRAGLVALAGALLGAVLLPVALGTTRWIGLLTAIVGVAGVVLVVWALALVRRASRERVDALAERARRLELERDQQAQAAVARERTRIAREMHDVVAHSLTVVAQADGGRYAAAGNPVAADRALATISAVSRDALADIRRILGVLRDGEPDSTTARAAGDRAPVGPQPAAADLEALVAQVRDSGLPVSLVRVGQPRPLPAGAGLALHRIVQEALTNVLKHGGPTARATVLVRWADGGVAVQVDDDGRGAAADGDGRGQGLVGMRERVAMFGGELQAGPRPGGGYRVLAQLPLAGAGLGTS